MSTKHFIALKLKYSSTSFGDFPKNKRVFKWLDCYGHVTNDKHKPSSLSNSLAADCFVFYYK